jgi:hypothetical protein
LFSSIPPESEHSTFASYLLPSKINSFYLEQQRKAKEEEEERKKVEDALAEAQVTLYYIYINLSSYLQAFSLLNILNNVDLAGK